MIAYLFFLVRKSSWQAGFAVMTNPAVPLLDLVERVQRLSIQENVVGQLTPADVEQLQYRVNQAQATLASCDGSPESLEAATPGLCSLSVECISAVERTELSTGPARLVTAGCEVLAHLLQSKAQGAIAPGNFSWVEETLTELSDQMDFLALELYCGLGRLEGAVQESEALPVLMTSSADPEQDTFGHYWGSIEHKQVLQELSTWLMCVIFRALGYSAVTAKTLMEFANNDVFLLCSLLRGLLAARPATNAVALTPRSTDSLPEDALELQKLALNAICGLAAPELAFSGNSHYARTALVEGAGIVDQTRMLGIYIEVLGAAMVETGVLDVALQAAAGMARAAKCGLMPAVGAPARFLSFLVSLTLQTDEEAVCERTLREVAKRADELGRLVEDLLELQPSAIQMKDLATSCAGLSCAIASAHQVDGKADGVEDGLTLACRVLLTTALDPASPSAVPEDDAMFLSALVVLAANVEDLALHRANFEARLARLGPEHRGRARARLTRTDSLRLPVREGLMPSVLAVFDSANAAADDAAAAATEKAAAEAAAAEAAAEEAARLAAAQRAACDAAAAAAVAQATKQVIAAAPPKASAGHATKGGGSGGGLRDLVQGAPDEFRCALDRKLLCDPVASPQGVVFERAVLARWLQKHGAVCPITGQPLQLEDCTRRPDIRRSVTEWVRQQRAPKHKQRDD